MKAFHPFSRPALFLAAFARLLFLSPPHHLGAEKFFGEACQIPGSRCEYGEKHGADTGSVPGRFPNTKDTT